MTIGKVTVPLLIKRSDLVAQLVNLTSVCIKKMCTEKKNHLIEGRRRELKVCKRREKKREGGNFSLLDLPPPPLPTFEKQNSDAMNSIGYRGLTPAIYLLLYGPVLRKRGENTKGTENTIK